MPEVSQYDFSHQELLTILVREAGVKTGKWTLVMNFGFTAGNYGPNPDEVVPGAFTAVTKVGIAKANEGSPENLVVDAAEVASP